MARKKEAEDLFGKGAPGWVVTYGDMMSLLLCFFILLLSFANMDIVKFKQAAGSLQRALGILRHDPTSERVAIVKPLQPKLAELSQKQEERLQTIKHVLQRKNVGTIVQASGQRSGIRFTIEDTVLFERGSWRLRPEAEAVLGGVADALNRYTDEVRIDGHTDSVPFAPAVGATEARLITDNMWLSVARAYEVRRVLAERFGVRPERMSIQGFGANKPAVPGESPEAMARNRRVEIWLLSQELRDVRSEFSRATLPIPMDYNLPPLQEWEHQAR